MDGMFQASTPYTLESESLRMDCIMSGGSSPGLAINTVTNKVGHGRRRCRMIPYKGSCFTLSWEACQTGGNSSDKMQARGLQVMS